MAMQHIDMPRDLLALARAVGVRSDWHEPDEQGLTVQITGTEFDNAGFWGTGDPLRDTEMCVKLYQDGKPFAVVNLATLLAWATEYARTLE